MVSSEIHKEYADTDLRKAPALFDLCDPRYKKFACIHEPGKNNVVLFRNIAEFLLLIRQDHDCVAVKFVILPHKGQLIADLDRFQNRRVRQMRRAGHERIKQMDLLCKRLDDIPEITFFYKGDKAILFYGKVNSMVSVLADIHFKNAAAPYQ